MESPTGYLKIVCCGWAKEGGRR